MTSVTVDHKKYFNHRSPGTYGGLGEDPILRHLDAAYKIAGLESPDILAEYDRLLAAEPGADAAAVAAISEVMSANDPKKWLTGALKAVERGMAADALRKSYRLHKSRVITASKEALVAQALEDLQPYFEKVTGALVEASQGLPSDDPLNYDRIFATDSTRSFRVAVSALGALGTMASLWRVNGSAVGVGAGQALTVVRVPRISEPLPIDRLSNAPLEEITEERRQVREFAHVANRESVDAALLAVAQGRWSALSFGLPTEGYALRVHWAEMAVSSIRSDSWN